MTFDSPAKKIELGVIAILATITLFYGAWKMLPLVAGPKIEIYTPKEGDVVSSGIFEVSGKVSRVKETTLQGRVIPIGTDGYFREILMAKPPYTILVFTVTDFYDKSITKTIRVTPQQQ